MRALLTLSNWHSASLSASASAIFVDVKAKPKSAFIIRHVI